MSSLVFRNTPPHWKFTWKMTEYISKLPDTSVLPQDCPLTCQHWNPITLEKKLPLFFRFQVSKTRASSHSTGGVLCRRLAWADPSITRRHTCIVTPPQAPEEAGEGENGRSITVRKTPTSRLTIEPPTGSLGGGKALVEQKCKNWHFFGSLWFSF